MDSSPNLTLPYIIAAQAQKHVTHNEAIRALDALVQMMVLDKDLASPPGSPADGSRYIVAASPTGAWAGQAGKIAAYQDGAWAFYTPREGWLAWIADEDKVYAYSGSAWAELTVPAAGAVQYSGAQSLSAAEALQARTNVYASPLDAMAYLGLQVNGAHRVSQQNGGTAGTTDGYHPSDQNRIAKSLTTATISVQRVSDAPPGYDYSAKLTVTANDASLDAAEHCYFSQKIEGWRTSRLAFGGANARPLSIGVWVKASVTGTYGIAIRNSAANRSWIGTITVSSANTWEFKALTISGDTTGTWLTGTSVGLEVAIALGLGSNYHGAAGWNATDDLGLSSHTNLLATNSATFQYTGLVVLPGLELPSADRAWAIQRHYPDDLTACQRYFYQTLGTVNGEPTVNGYGGAAGIDTVAMRLPVPMRIIPTITSSGTWSVGNCSQPSFIADQASYIMYVIVTALGSYNAQPNGSGIVSFDARM